MLIYQLSRNFSNQETTSKLYKNLWNQANHSFGTLSPNPHLICSKNMMEIREATEGVEAIVYNITTAHAVIPLAEQLQVPCFGSYTLPVFPTNEFAPPILGMTSTGFGTKKQ